MRFEVITAFLVQAMDRSLRNRASIKAPDSAPRATTNAPPSTSGATEAVFKTQIFAEDVSGRLKLSADVRYQKLECLLKT